MKTTIKTLISVGISVCLAFVFFYMVQVVSERDDRTKMVNDFQDMMVESKLMFLEKSETIALLVPVLIENEGMSIIRSKDGKAYIENGDGSLSEISEFFSGEDCSYIIEVMSDYDAAAVVLNIKVTNGNVLFFTHYHRAGCVGFLYEKEAGTFTSYELIDINENWRVFFRMEG